MSVESGVVTPLLSRRELLTLLDDKAAEFVAHVQVSPPSDHPDRDPYAVFDIDRDQVKVMLDLRPTVHGFYGDVDRSDGHLNVILGKGLCDEHGHLNPQGRSDAIDALLAENARLRDQVAVVCGTRDDLAADAVRSSDDLTVAWQAAWGWDDPAVVPGRPGWSAALDEVRKLRAERDHYRDACSAQNYEIEQALGKALEYPRFADDQKNFPDATEADGVVVGDHTACSLADEIADAYRKLRAERDDLRRQLEFVGRAATGGDHPTVAKGHPCWSEELEKVRALSDRMDTALLDRDRLRVVLRQRDETREGE